MNERIKELVEKVGATVHKAMHGEAISFLENDLERFADLVCQDEREACAKLCDDIADRIMGDNVTGSDGAGYCVKEIRARSNNRTKTSKDICGND
jgi:hypothetical protein